MTNESKTEETKSAETTTETKTNNNKAIFGPLGKYAVVAVIIVGIIVTTAVMLDKQMAVEEEIAAIEAQRDAGLAALDDAEVTLQAIRLVVTR